MERGGAKIYKKVYYNTSNPDILEVRKVPIRIEAKKDVCKDFLIRINRKFLSFGGGERFCHLCEKALNSDACLLDHLRGKIHRKNVVENKNL